MHEKYLMLPLIDLILHMNDYIGVLLKDYGLWIYLIFFIIIFLETGLVIFPFLPGDSLLFLAGAFIAIGSLNFIILFATFASAAILGDTLNYWIGHRAGKRIAAKGLFYIKKEHIKKAQDFYTRHGGKTIFVSRFLPFIRTFAPFVAGMGAMNYRRFIAFNVAGAAAWVAAFLGAGYFFGNIPIVRENFGLVIAGIVIVTVIAALIGFMREYFYKDKGNKDSKQTMKENIS